MKFKYSAALCLNCQPPLKLKFSTVCSMNQAALTREKCVLLLLLIVFQTILTSVLSKESRECFFRAKIRISPCCQSQHYMLLKYFLHLRIKLSRNSNVNAYPLLSVLFLTMGKFLNKHSDEIERTDKLCKKMFYSDLFFCQTFPWMISLA